MKFFKAEVKLNTGRQLLRGLVVALALATMPGVASAGSSATPPAATAPAAPTAPQPTPASPGEISDYAGREAASPGLAQFEGGDVVIIGTTAALIILVVVLLIVLL